MDNRAWTALKISSGLFQRGVVAEKMPVEVNEVLRSQLSSHNQSEQKLVQKRKELIGGLVDDPKSQPE